MGLDFMAVVANLTGLFIIAAFGYGFTKAGILKAEYSTIFSQLLLKITLPCTIFVSLVTREYDPSFVYDSLTIIAIGLISFPILLFLFEYVAKILGVPEHSRGTWSFCATFSNSGFVGFPMYGAEGLALAVMFNITFNIHIYTLGAIVMSHDGTGKHESPDMKSIIFSNINIGLLLSLIFYFGQIKVPEILLTPLNYISQITTPLSMLIIGIILGTSGGKNFLTDKNAWSNTLVRLIICPAAMFFVMKLLPLNNPLISSVVVLIMAMPAAGVSSMMAEIYHGDLNLVAKIMFIQNIACLGTIPLVCTLFS